MPPIRAPPGDGPVEGAPSPLGNGRARDSESHRGGRKEALVKLPPQGRHRTTASPFPLADTPPGYVEDFEHFVKVQSESALRHVTTRYDYDEGADHDPREVTLRAERGRVTGTFAGDRGSGEISAGLYDRPTLHFTISAQIDAETHDWIFRGTVDDDQVDGTVSTNLGTFEFSGSKEP